MNHLNLFLSTDILEWKFAVAILFNFLPKKPIRSFHRAANAILFSRVKRKNEILLKLLYGNCVPILTYGSAVREFSAVDMRRCHIALNNAIRRIFFFATWQSIRDLRINHGYRSIYEIYADSKEKFLTKASQSTNEIVRCLSSLPFV